MVVGTRDFEAVLSAGNLYDAQQLGEGHTQRLFDRWFDSIEAQCLVDFITAGVVISSIRSFGKDSTQTWLEHEVCNVTLSFRSKESVSWRSL